MLHLNAYCTHCGQETVHERDKLVKDRYGLGLTALFGWAVLPFWLAAASADLFALWKCTGCGTEWKLKFDRGRGRGGLDGWWRSRAGTMDRRHLPIAVALVGIGLVLVATLTTVTYLADVANRPLPEIGRYMTIGQFVVGALVGLVGLYAAIWQRSRVLCVTAMLILMLVVVWGLYSSIFLLQGAPLAEL